MQRNRTTRIVGGLLVATLTVCAGYFLFFRTNSSTHAETFKKEFTLSYTDYIGNTVRFSDFKGKPLVVFLWASWCPYCSAEIQNLAKLKKIFGADVNAVAVNRGEPAAVAKDFSSKLSDTEGVQFLLDPDDALYKSIGGYAMPETLFIDASGVVVFHQRGPMQPKEASDELNKMLGR